MYCLVVFLIFKGFFASLKSSFFDFGKILPHPREFDHHFLPRGRELDKKNCPGGRDSLAQKNFPGGCPGWGCTRLELTETLLLRHNQFEAIHEPKFADCQFWYNQL